MVHYGLGRIAGKETVRRLPDPDGSCAAADFTSWFHFGAVHVVPSSSSTVRESGSAGDAVRVRDFLLGTLAGMSPGILAVVVLGNPTPAASPGSRDQQYPLLTGLASFFGLLGAAFYRWYGTRPLRASS